MTTERRKSEAEKAVAGQSSHGPETTVASGFELPGEHAVTKSSAVADAGSSGSVSSDGTPARSSGKKAAASSGFTRAIRLLEEITKHGPLRFAQLQERLELPKASLNRALTDLQLERMIEFDERSLTYSAGFRMLEFANQIWSRSDLRTLARDQLEKLSASSNETVQLSVLADTYTVHLDSVESQNNVRMSMGFGTKTPAYCTSAGKALLAWCPVEQQKTIISRISFAVYTPNTITNPKQLLAELADIRKQGYANDNEEHFAGILSVAVPVVTGDGDAIAAISITRPHIQNRTITGRSMV